MHPLAHVEWLALNLAAGQMDTFSLLYGISLPCFTFEYMSPTPITKMGTGTSQGKCLRLGLAADQSLTFDRGLGRLLLHRSFRFRPVDETDIPKIESTKEKDYGVRLR